MKTRIIWLVLAVLALAGCNSQSEMKPEDSMESTLKEAQKNAGKTSKDNEWKPKGGPSSAENATKTETSGEPKSGGY